MIITAVHAAFARALRRAARRNEGRSMKPVDDLPPNYTGGRRASTEQMSSFYRRASAITPARGLSVCAVSRDGFRFRGWRRRYLRDPGMPRRQETSERGNRPDPIRCPAAEPCQPLPLRRVGLLPICFTKTGTPCPWHCSTVLSAQAGLNGRAPLPLSPPTMIQSNRCRIVDSAPQPHLTSPKLIASCRITSLHSPQVSSVRSSVKTTGPSAGS